MNIKRLNLRSVAKMTVACLAVFKRSALLVGAIAISAMLMFTSCEKDDTKINPDPIKPTTAEVTADKTTTVGDIKANGYQLTIPAGTFDTDVTVRVTASDTEAANAYKKSGAFTNLSEPISITVDGKEGTVWLKELVKISFPLPKGFAVTEENIYTIFGSFYNPDTKSVDYIYPDWDDLRKGIITFTTSHFTDGAGVQAKEQEAFKKFAKGRASESLKTDNKKASSTTNAALTDLYNEIYDNMGITDPSIKGILVTGLIKETDLGTIAVAIREGKVGDIAGKVHEMAVNHLLVKMKIDAGVNAAMTKVQSASIKGVVNGIAYALDGDYTGAAKAMSDAFLEYAFPPAKYMKIGIELINYAVASWNDYELQYAIEIFENKGYTSIPDSEWDIETTTSSLAAYLREVQKNAVKSYCGINGVSESQLSSSDKESIRSQAERDLKKMVEDRLAARAQMKQKEAEYLDIIKHFKDDELLDFFDYDMPMDFRLNRLFMVRQTILNMVGGPLIHPLRTPEECLRDATYYYVRIYVYERGGKKMIPGGQQEFIDWLKSEGYIAASYVNMAGTRWRISAPGIITNLDISFLANNTCTALYGTLSGTWSQADNNVIFPTSSYVVGDFSEEFNFSGKLTSPTIMSGSVIYIRTDFRHPEDSKTISGTFTATKI